MATLKATDLVGAVSMLYAILLHQDSMSSDTQSCMVELDTDVVNVIIATLQFFNRVCELNLEFFQVHIGYLLLRLKLHFIWKNYFLIIFCNQNILGAEGISLQVRHIISYLLKYCVQNEGYKELLHKVIEFIGFFAIHHHDNQVFFNKKRKELSISITAFYITLSCFRWYFSLDQRQQFFSSYQIYHLHTSVIHL